MTADPSRFFDQPDIEIKRNTIGWRSLYNLLLIHHIQFYGDPIPHEVELHIMGEMKKLRKMLERREKTKEVWTNQDTKKGG